MIARSFKPLFASLLVASGLVACAEQWTKPGETQTQFQALKSSCETRAAQRFPPVVSQTISVDQTSLPKPVMTCNNMDSANNQMAGSNGMMGPCNAMDNTYVPPSVHAVDVNESAREQDARKCLLDNGWQPAKSG